MSQVSIIQAFIIVTTVLHCCIDLRHTDDAFAAEVVRRRPIIRSGHFGYSEQRQHSIQKTVRTLSTRRQLNARQNAMT